MPLSAEELLAGAGISHEVSIPSDLLGTNGAELSTATVKLRALTVRDLQRIGAAARDDDSLSATLLIQQALVEPELQVDQIMKMSAGLARFLVEQINTISGMSTPRDALEEAVQAPLAKACFILAREFGWTPEQVSALTIGQLLLYLEMGHAAGRTQ